MLHHFLVPSHARPRLCLTVALHHVLLPFVCGNQGCICQLVNQGSVLLIAFRQLRDATHPSPCCSNKWAPVGAPRGGAAPEPQVKGQLKRLKGKGAAKDAHRRQRRLAAKVARQRERIAEARAALDEALTSGWRTFEVLRDVLVRVGGPTPCPLQLPPPPSSRGRGGGAQDRTCSRIAACCNSAYEGSEKQSFSRLLAQLYRSTGSPAQPAAR